MEEQLSIQQIVDKKIQLEKDIQKLTRKFIDETRTYITKYEFTQTFCPMADSSEKDAIFLQVKLFIEL